MRFMDLCDKAVVCASDCRCLGHVSDIEFDSKCGEIRAIIVPGPAKYLGSLFRDEDICIPWVNIIRIGPDIILVELKNKIDRQG